MSSPKLPDTTADASEKCIIVPVPVKRKTVRIDSKSPTKVSCYSASQNGSASGAASPLIGGDQSADALPSSAAEDANGHKASLYNYRSSLISGFNATGASSGLTLYEDDTMSMPTLAAYLRSFTFPGPEPLNKSADAVSMRTKKVAKLGTLLGVYLPTIQHILGVQMFLRLLWIVGVGGVTHSFIMVFICCLCTFLTCISVSAIATNGVIESGGAYFLISRNLGTEFGTAVGMLYYLANTVAASMYLIGGVEVLLIYMAPGLPQFSSETGPDGHADSAMFHNFRIYATGLLLIETIIVAMGVKFVQCFAPISLFCVIVSILSVYVGAGTAGSSRSPMICLMDGKLLKPSAYSDSNGTALCNKTLDGPLYNYYCSSNASELTCAEFLNSEVEWVAGIPGFSAQLLSDNAAMRYMEAEDAVPGRKALRATEVHQDIASNFFIILAIFFPSVTGIFTGANMSGDLKDPQKSLPIGTLAAQCTTSFVYLSFVLVFGGSIHGALLRDKYGESLNNQMIVAALAWPNEWVLLIGSFTSTFGAALQCLCSAPRLLQSIARDDVIPFLRIFSDVTKRNEPINALCLTVIIAEIGILIGSIDDVAPIVDFFFLMCYCFVNAVCVLQTLLNAPNWRPRFTFYHWTVSLLGALLCLFIMFATYWYYAIVVIVLCASVYKYVEYKGAKKEWGDGIRGLALSTAQYSLLKIENGKHLHPKNWRPQLLVLVKADEDRWQTHLKLLQVAGQLKAGEGLTIVASLLIGDLASAEDRERAERIENKLQAALKSAKVRGFTKVVVCSNLGECVVSTLIQSVGVGGLRPNTVMVGWPYRWKQTRRCNKNYNAFLDAIHRAATVGMCLLVPKGLLSFPEQNDRLFGTIDVWWIIHDGGLLIVLPFLLKQHKVWRQCKLRVFAVAQMNDNSIKMKQDLQHWVYQLRIDASVDVVELSDSTISAYTYEKTLLMEERSRLAMDLQLSRQDIAHEPQFLVDRHRSRITLCGLSGDASDAKQTRTQTSADATAAPLRAAPPFRSSISTGVVTPPLPATASKNLAPKKSSDAASPTLPGKTTLVRATTTPVDETTELKQVGPDCGPGGGKRLARFFQGSPKASLSSIDQPMTPPAAQAAPFKRTRLTPPVDLETEEDCMTPSSEGSQESSSVSPKNSSSSKENVAELIDAQFKPINEKKSSLHKNSFPCAEPASPFDAFRPPEPAKSLPTDENAAYRAMCAKLDHHKVRKMNTAVSLNRIIRDKSQQAQLVVLNLPRPPRLRQGLGNYMHYLEALTEGLERVLLVRGSGKEVITIYS